MILALINNKGGVAKTTTAVNLSAALASAKRRVLLVDMDSQAAASLSLGLRRAELKPSLADVLLRDEPIRNVIRQTRVEGLDLLPGSNELAGVDVLMSGVSGKETRLRTALEELRDDYFAVIIDCPPSLSLLSINALLAAEYYIVPVTPHFLTLGGLASLVQEVAALRGRGLGPVADLMGFVMTLADYRNGSTQKMIEAIRGSWKELIFRTEIRINVKLAEAPSFGRTIFEHAPGCTGAAAYRQLAQEVLQRCPGEEDDAGAQDAAAVPAEANANTPAQPESVPLQQ